MRPRAVHFNELKGQPLHIYEIWELRFHFTEMRINTSKVRLVKSSFGGLRTPFLFDFSFFKGLHVLGFFDQSYDFSRKSLSKYLMDTIDFNKHDINIFINLAKIVCYGRHWDESCNEWRYDTINYKFWRQLSQCEIAPIWRLQKYVHFKYILWHFEYMS
jgi:hypothetical protein